ncbi:MAG: adenylate kinase family protein [Buchnera aphidicola (Eriosoma harunire)]
MNIILIGAPGTGKGTHAQFISNKYHLHPIYTGDLLKNIFQETTHNNVINKINNGKLINDDIVIRTVEKEMMVSNIKNGFLLDGFPRTINQANYLNHKKIKINYILHFFAPENLIIERIMGRQIHLPSGRIYHDKFNPPKSKGIDDITGEKLTIRLDDHKNIIQKRIQEYHKCTYPIIEFYKKQTKNKTYYKIDTRNSIQKIQTYLTSIIK